MVANKSTPEHAEYMYFTTPAMEALRNEPSIYVEWGADAWNLVDLINEARIGEAKDVDEHGNKIDSSADGVLRRVRA
eukprot:10063618-Alexandrium_andersonii.AAC.1